MAIPNWFAAEMDEKTEFI